jgi:hypothetical protein
MGATTLPDFPEMVGYFKGLREQHQKIPYPVPYPPHLICYDGETTVGQIATSTGDPQSLAAMLSAIPVLHADYAILSMQSVVREASGPPMDVPLGQDPNALPAMLTVAAARNGQDVSVDAFTTDDAGDLTWCPGLWYSPLPNLLVGAMHEVFDAEIPNSVGDFVIWMQLNKFAIKVHPSLYQQPDDD